MSCSPDDKNPGMVRIGESVSPQGDLPQLRPSDIDFVTGFSTTRMTGRSIPATGQAAGWYADGRRPGDAEHHLQADGDGPADDDADASRPKKVW